CRMQRPVVVLPQPDSPTRPRVSPRRSAKLTPSTARTVPARPPNIPPPTLKCLTRSRTSSSASPPPAPGAAVTVAPSARGLILSLQARRLPARADVAGVAHRLQRRRLVRAPVDAEGAARGERAARGQPREVGRLPVDGRQPGLPRLVQARHRAQQAERVGMAGVAVQLARRAPLDDPPR